MKKRDLFVVVADLDAENTIKTLLTSRQQSLGIELDFLPDRYPQGDILRYSGRDSGCYRDAIELLRPAQRTHRKALIMFDRHGSGAENRPVDEICHEIEQNLALSGWPEGSAAVVVFAPELETWVWTHSKKVSAHLGWADRVTEMHQFLMREGLWNESATKPHDPKRALVAALRHSRVQLSARLFSKLAAEVSLSRCGDPCFKKLTQHLQSWFPVSRQTNQDEPE